MDHYTRRRITTSIENFYAILEGHEHVPIPTRPLCRKFLVGAGNKACRKCPVYAVTKDALCRGTPMQRFFALHTRLPNTTKIPAHSWAMPPRGSRYRPALVAAAQDSINFLYTLLTFTPTRKKP